MRLGDNANGYVVADAVRIVGGTVPPAAEMDVSEASRSITSSLATAPSATNGTDFGSVAVGIIAPAEVFTISNTGNVNLHLSGSPQVTISGPGAADFSVIAQPAAVVAPGGQTTFQVAFHPSALGLRQATLTIADDDPDAAESPYTFNIQGTGIPSGPIQTILDDSSAGFFAAGPWSTSTDGAGYAGEVKSDAAGAGSDRAVWTFTNVAAGPYIVFATWTASASNATNAPFLVTDGTAAHSTYYVNQQQAPSGFSDAGLQWTQLTTLNITTGMLTVMLTNNADGNVVADGIELVRADVPLPVQAAPGMAHNAAFAQDVNGDARVSTIDALIVINHLLTAGSASSHPAVASPSSSTSNTSNYFMDVNGDGIVSAIDALRVINYLMHPAASSPAAAMPSAVASPVVTTGTGGSTAAAVAPTSMTSGAFSAVAVDRAIADYDSSTAVRPAAGSQLAVVVSTEPSAIKTTAASTSAGPLAAVTEPAAVTSSDRCSDTADEASDPFDSLHD